VERRQRVAWAKRIGVDGFRLDAVKHIETAWLTDVRARLNAEVAFDQKFYMVGETFDGDRGIIKSYVNPNTMLDGQFDFPLRGQVLSTILRRDGQMGDLAGFLDSNEGFYGAGSVMSTFLGNHDVPRAIEIALDTPMFGAWDGGKWAAWSGQPQLPTSKNPFERLAVAYTLIYTMPGIPMIYYGDEFGMPGPATRITAASCSGAITRRTRRGCATDLPRSRRCAPNIRPCDAGPARPSACRVTRSSTR
jgi:glycosidase